MSVPARITEYAGRHALVDGIPFNLPVSCQESPALFAAFTIDARKAAQLLAGTEVHPFRLWNKGLLVVTVIDYRVTTIGKYIEFSVAIACTHGSKPAPRLLPAIFSKQYGTGQFVVELPVSSEISVKGGKGIWGMPKHQANLNYIVGDEWVSSQYDLDGKLAIKIEVKRPSSAWLPVNVGASNYCAFRGLLMKSNIFFKGKMGFFINKKGSARLTIGSHPRVQALKQLDISPEPIFAGFIPSSTGVLDDYFESWFLSYPQPPKSTPEGMESVVQLGLSQSWLAPPTAKQ